MPKHGDKAICLHCRKPIEPWDANPGIAGHRGEKSGDETEAEPDE